MLNGLEYVITAYGIWVCTFAVYILLTKRRLKITNQTVVALKQRASESHENSVSAEDNENSN